MKVKLPEQVMPSSKRVCIFCGKNRSDGVAFRLTKEDVWPIWLNEHVPRDLKNYTFGLGFVHKGRAEKTSKKIDGDPRSRRVKLICASCNNGWMSKLQERAKPILLPLIKGQHAILSPTSQTILALWCAMGVMTSDFFVPERQAIPQSDRDLLRLSSSIPIDTWKIWIGRFIRRDWKPHWQKNSIPIIDGDVDENLPLPLPNTQTTTLVFGELYVHAFSSVFPSVVADPRITNKKIEKIAQLWPISKQFIAWPINPITDQEADTLSGEIFSVIDALERATWK
jgi:hypothetical protein